MRRVAEPELMLTEQQAWAYAQADFTEMHPVMVERFRERFGAFSGGRLLDLGCGAADMTIRFAQAYPDVRALGVDGSEAMLRYGREALQRFCVEDRITLERRLLPDDSLDQHGFDAVIANSLLHHLREPMDLWSTIIHCAKAGAPVMVMDLRRAGDPAQAERVVEQFASRAGEVLKHDFFNSLCAAYTAAEIAEQLKAAGLRNFQVQEEDEVHVVIWGNAPEPQ